MDFATSSSGLRILANSVDLPRLTKTDSRLIRAFLPDYDQYARENTERAKQVASVNVTSTEVTNPVQLKFCVSSEWLGSVITLGFIKNGKSYDDLEGKQLHRFLELQSEAPKSIVALQILHKLVETHLRVDVPNADA